MFKKGDRIKCIEEFQMFDIYLNEIYIFDEHDEGDDYWTKIQGSDKWVQSRRFVKVDLEIFETLGD